MVMFLVIFFLSFHAFPEKWPFLSAFIVHPDIDPPPTAKANVSNVAWRGLRRHQIVDISLIFLDPGGGKRKSLMFPLALAGGNVNGLCFPWPWRGET